MAHTKVTPLWVLREAAHGFVAAWGRRKPMVYRERLELAVHSVCVDVLPTDSIEGMRRRARRAGRILADEAMRKRLKAVSLLDLGIMPGHRVYSKELGVALRLTETYSPALDRNLYRIDMLGSRYVPPDMTQPAQADSQRRTLNPT